MSPTVTGFLNKKAPPPQHQPCITRKMLQPLDDFDCHFMYLISSVMWQNRRQYSRGVYDTLLYTGIRILPIFMEMPFLIICLFQWHAHCFLWIIHHDLTISLLISHCQVWLSIWLGFVFLPMNTALHWIAFAAPLPHHWVDPGAASSMYWWSERPTLLSTPPSWALSGQQSHED